MARHNELGRQGESWATEYLLARGYTIHKQDTRMQGKGEIDIIAFRGDEVVFIEVKTRTEADTDPMEVVDSRRRARMCRAAEAFIQNMKLDQRPRFDIIVINVAPDGTYRLSHYPDAFIPPLNGGYR